MSNEERKDLEEVVNELNEQVEEFAVVAKEEIKDSSEKTKRTVEEVTDDTMEAIKTLIEQVKIKYEEITESEKFIEFGEAVKGLTTSLVQESKRKIKDIKENEDIKETWDKTKEAAVNTSNEVTESIKDNEQLMETINIVKGVTVDIAKKSAKLIKSAYADFMGNPKVKEGIVKAKATTLDVAGKAYDKLEDWLTDEDKEIAETTESEVETVEEEENKEV